MQQETTPLNFLSNGCTLVSSGRINSDIFARRAVTALDFTCPADGVSFLKADHNIGVYVSKCRLLKSKVYSFSIANTLNGRFNYTWRDLRHLLRSLLADVCLLSENRQFFVLLHSPGNIPSILDHDQSLRYLFIMRVKVVIQELADRSTENKCYSHPKHPKYAHEKLRFCSISISKGFKNIFLLIIFCGQYTRSGLLFKEHNCPITLFL